jgi:hypothetical protein
MIAFMIRNICTEADGTIRMFLEIPNAPLKMFQMINAIARHCGDSNKDVKMTQCD